MTVIVEKLTVTHLVRTKCLTSWNAEVHPPPHILRLRFPAKILQEHKMRAACLTHPILFDQIHPPNRPTTMQAFHPSCWLQGPQGLPSSRSLFRNLATSRDEVSLIDNFRRVEWRHACLVLLNCITRDVWGVTDVIHRRFVLDPVPGRRFGRKLYYRPHETVLFARWKSLS
jgi:hypothetical protein